jgi:transcriptional regulator PpsR
VSSRGTKYWNSGAIPLIGPDVLGDIIANAADVAIVISDVGKVLSVMVNPNHPGRGRIDHWEGRDIRDVLTAESIDKLETQMRRFVTGKGANVAMELNHTDVSNWDYPVRYTLHEIGPDGAILMLGRDMRQIAEMQQQLVKAQMALERDYEQQRKADTRFRVLLEASRDAVAFVSIGNGRITELNSSAALLLGSSVDDLQGAAFAQEFESRRKGEFMTSLSASAVADQNTPMELTTRRSRRPVTVTPTVFRAAGERILMCRIEPTGDVDQPVDELTENLSGLYQEGVDAIVFTDKDGIIKAANEAFLNMADAPHLTVVKGKSLSEYLVRGAVDTKVLIENATRSGKMRLFATKLSSEYGMRTPVEISATYLNDRTHPALVFVIRDASRAEAMRKPGVAVNDDSVRSVMELVGSATLKDIVNETTEVVEKMCIETAVELTRNNRVAAAEMLGLSRQSLYVKLRKYGLLSKGGD